MAELRLCFFGDSFVNGTGDDACLGWVGRVCAGARRRGHDVTCYNLGIRRNTSADVRGRWRREAEARLPEGPIGRLVFSFGANDCVEEEGRVRVPFAESAAHARAILREAVAWRPVLMVGPLPVGDAATDARIGALAGAYGTVCAEAGVPYLDLFAEVSAAGVWAAEAAAGDGAHPNEGGYGLVADAVGRWEAWRGWVPDGA